MKKNENDKLTESTQREPSHGGVENTNHPLPDSNPKTYDVPRRFSRIQPQVLIELADASDVRGFARTYLGDISLGGMFVKTSRPRPPGTRVRFRLPARHDAPAGEIGGTVVRIIGPDQVDPDNPSAGMAIQFGAEIEEGVEWLKDLISEYAQLDEDNEPILLGEPLE